MWLGDDLISSAVKEPVAGDMDTETSNSGPHTVFSAPCALPRKQCLLMESMLLVETGMLIDVASLRNGDTLRAVGERSAGRSITLPAQNIL